jgi:hypothetical protein
MVFLSETNSRESGSIWVWTEYIYSGCKISIWKMIPMHWTRFQRQKALRSLLRAVLYSRSPSPAPWWIFQDFHICNGCKKIGTWQYFSSSLSSDFKNGRVNLQETFGSRHPELSHPKQARTLWNSLSERVNGPASFTYIHPNL